MSNIFQRVRQTPKNFILIELKFDAPDLINESSLRSKCFSAAEETTWFLEFEPSTHSHLYLRNDGDHQYDALFLRFTTAVFNLKGTVLHACSFSANIDFSTDIPFDLLRSFNSLKQHKSIRIACCLELIKVPKRTEAEIITTDHQISLFKGFKNLRDQDIGTNVSLEIGGKHTIRAHQLVLCVRSPAFKDILSCDTIGITPKIIIIQDTRASIMEELVNYLYTNTKRFFELVDTFDLYIAADKYKVFQLKEECQINLLCYLQPSNARRIFEFANQNRDNFLADEALAYICTNVKEKVKTEFFEELGEK